MELVGVSDHEIVAIDDMWGDFEDDLVTDMIFGSVAEDVSEAKGKVSEDWNFGDRVASDVGEEAGQDDGLISSTRRMFVTCRWPTIG